MKVSLSIPDKLVAEVDELRGDVSRSRFVTRGLENYVGMITSVAANGPDVVFTGSSSPPSTFSGRIPSGHGVRRVRSDG